MSNWLLDPVHQQQLSAALQFYQALARLQQGPPSMELSSALPLLLRGLQGGAGTAEQTQLSTLLGSDALSGLQQEWAALQSQLAAALPSQLQLLLQPLSSISQPQRLPLLQKAASGSLPLGQLALALSAQASTALQCDVLAGSGIPADWSADLAPDECLLRLQLDGQLAASAAGKLAWAWGAVQSDNSGQGAVSIAYLYRNPAARNLLQALQASWPAWPQPGELADVLAPANAPFAIQVKMQGQLALNTQVSAGTSLLQSLGADGSLAGASIHTDLSASLALTLQQQAQWQLDVLPAADGLHLKLNQQAQQQNGSVLQLAATAQAQGLEPWLQHIMAQLPDAQALLEVIGPYQQPGILLNQKLDAALQTFAQQHGTAASVVGLALGRSSAEQIAQQFADQLRQSIQTEVDQKLALWQVEPATASSQLLAVISQRLQLDQDLSASLQGQLQAPAAAAIGQLQSELQSRLQSTLSSRLGQLSDATRSELNQLLAPLAAIGQQVDAQLTAWANQVGQLVTVIEQWLNQYQAMLGRLRSGLQQLIAQKVGLALSVSQQASDQQSGLFSCRIVKQSDNSARLYRACWLGRLDELPDLLRATQAEGSVDQLAGSWQSLLSNSNKLNLSIQLGSFALGWQSCQLSEVAVTASADGGLQLVSSKAQLEASSQLFGEQSNALLVSQLDLAMLNDPQSLSQPFSVQYQLQEDSLSDPELAEYAGSLIQAGLLEQARFDQLRSNLPADPATRQHAKLSSSLSLRLPQLQAWLAQSDMQIYQTAIKSLLDVAGKALSGQAAFHGEPLENWIATLCEALSTDDVTDAINFANANDKEALAEKLGLSVSTAIYPAPVNAIYWIAKEAAGIRQGSAALRSSESLLQTIASNPTQLTQDAVRSQLASLSQQIAQAFGPATVDQTSLLGGSDKVPWPTLGFYAFLADLLEVPRSNCLLTQLQLADGRRWIV